MRWQIYSISVLFSLCLGANETTFVNHDTSKLKIMAICGHPGTSHFYVFRPLFEELARRGHEIHVISHFPRSNTAKAKEPLPTYKDLSIANSEIGTLLNIIDLSQLKQPYLHVLQTMNLLKPMADMACNVGLKNPVIKKVLESDEKYDLIITENFNTNCFLGFVHRFKVPYMTLSSHEIMPWASEDMGIVHNPSYIPSIFSNFASPMDFFDRLSNAFQVFIAKLIYEYHFRSASQTIANEVFGPDLPDLKKIAKQSQALLVNTHYTIHGNKPLLSNVVEIGGIHISCKTNPLPKDIAEFLDNAHEGVLYFNFGSMIKISTMPQDKLDVILKVLKSIPRKVIWKWESDDVPFKLDNVMVKKWLPQFSIMSFLPIF